MKISVNFDRVTGKIKPMHGVGQPPMSIWTSTDKHFHFLEEAGIPISRLHDTSGRYGAGVYVDIPNIFRDFGADETDPASYDFRSTDRVVKGLYDRGVAVFYRLGVTIENDVDVAAYRIDPPADYEKWARICEHVVRHYNEGWANGFRFGIRYFEVWNEPDNAQMWTGTAEDYFRLYEVTSKHLKACFGDSIAVGGLASCGFYAMDKDPDLTGLDHPAVPKTEEYFIEFAHGFLKHQKAAGAPLDFFSWHDYGQPKLILARHRYLRRLLEAEGFGDVPDILNEWNPCHHLDNRFWPKASATVLATMLGMQKEPGAELLNYYDASMGLMSYSGLFYGDTQTPTLAYYAFMAFSHLYRNGAEVLTASDDEDVFVGAAKGDHDNVLLISNLKTEPVEAEIDLSGWNCRGYEILEIDATHSYTPSGRKIVDGKLTLTPESCTEIRFW